MDSKMFGQELLTKNFRGRDGIQHMFKHMKEKGYKSADVSSLGGKFDNSDNYFDLKFVDGKALKFIEYKSYLPDGFGTSEHIKQFKEYLRDITDLKQLNYVFNITKADQVIWKNKFQKIFRNNPDLFDEFWNNEGLRRKLFGSDVNKAEAKSDFIDMIDSFDDILFEFIKAN